VREVHVLHVGRRRERHGLPIERDPRRGAVGAGVSPEEVVERPILLDHEDDVLDRHVIGEVQRLGGRGGPISRVSRSRIDHPLAEAFAEVPPLLRVRQWEDRLSLDERGDRGGGLLGRALATGRVGAGSGEGQEPEADGDQAERSRGRQPACL